MPPYRVMYNQDCTNLFGITRESIRPEHVDRMVDEVADGGADAMLINPNAQKVNYPSAVWQTYWDGYRPGDASFFGSFGAAEGSIESREHCVRQMKTLADSGCDYVQCALARCRANGIAPGVTVRMNDMHDAPWPDSGHHSRFYKQHPEFHLPGPLSLGWGRVAMNYEHAAVREHYMTLLRELVERYDFDVLDLDFARFSNYFPRGNFDEHCAVMTGFVRQVRELTRAAKHPISLLARVAATPAAAFEQGFDLAAWAKEKLVDGIAFTQFLSTGWEMPVEEFRALVGGDVALYAGAEFAADRRPGLDARKMPLDAPLMRGFASAYRSAGADGIYIFNYFCARETTTMQEPLFATLGEIADPARMRGLPKKWLTTCAGIRVPDADLPEQVPAAIATSASRTFEMLLAADEGMTVTANILFTAQAGIAPAQLWLQCNNVPIGQATSVADGPAAEKHQYRTAVFAIPARALRDGRNRLTLRNEGPEITVHGLEVTAQ